MEISKKTYGDMEICFEDQSEKKLGRKCKLWYNLGICSDKNSKILKKKKKNFFLDGYFGN